jgi:hypothetical protein
VLQHHSPSPRACRQVDAAPLTSRVPCATLLHAVGSILKWDTSWLTVDEAVIQFHRRTWRVGGPEESPKTNHVRHRGAFDTTPGFW